MTSEHRELYWDLPTNDVMQLIDSLITQPRSVYQISALLGVSDRTSVRLISECRKLGAVISTSRSVVQHSSGNVVSYLYQIDNRDWANSVLQSARSFLDCLNLSRKQ